MHVLCPLRPPSPLLQRCPLYTDQSMVEDDCGTLKCTFPPVPASPLYTYNWREHLLEEHAAGIEMLEGLFREIDRCENRAHLAPAHQPISPVG